MTTVASMVSPHDIRELVSSVDPVASVYLGPLADPADDGQLELMLRRRTIARHLAEQGADDPTIDLVGNHLANLPEYAGGYVVFARDGEVVLAQPLPGVTGPDLTGYGSPPRVGPLLTWLQRHPAHVRAVVDRTGADLAVYRAGSPTGRQHTVTGPDDEIRRRFPGGGQWPHMQRRAEDSWRHNAAAVASAIEEDLARVHAQLLLLAGDPKAVQLVIDRLRLRAHPPVLRILPGSRHSDGIAGPERVAATARILSEYADTQSAALVEQLEDRLAPHGSAVQGVTATINALARGDVRTLLIADDAADHRIGWFGPDVLCAVEQPDARPDSPRPQTGRLADIAIRAALLTRADVRVLTPGQATKLDSGIGGLLRHP